MSQLQTRQRGVGTLAVSTLLLFGTTIVVFYLNRGVIFEQKASANQLRSTAAFEAAEAGLEWATGMLNRSFDIDSSCNFGTAVNNSFRRRYVQSAWNAASSPTANVVVAPAVLPIGCYIDSANALQCSCPAVAATTSTVASPTSKRPAFSVTFAAVAGDPRSVLVTSVGCSGASWSTAANAFCSGTSLNDSDSTATVRAILKFRNILRAAPAAALTCGTTCDTSATGNFNVVNYDASVNGITINSGTTTSYDVADLGTVPGIPIENSVIANDLSLKTLSDADPGCTNDVMFGAFFGSTIDAFKRADATATVVTKQNFLDAYDLGYRSFYFANGAPLQGSMPDIGSQDDPVTIVVANGNLSLNSTNVIYGLIFSDSASAGALGTGSSVIRGAMVTCAAFTSNGNGAVVYDGKALSNAQLNTAALVRVPGSWRDF